MSDYFRDDAVCIVEWPERVSGRLPTPDLALSLAYGPEDAGRTLVATAHTRAGEECLTALAPDADAQR